MSNILDNLNSLMRQKNSFKGYVDEAERRLANHARTVKRIREAMDGLNKEFQEECDAYRRELDVVRTLKEVGTTSNLNKTSIFLEDHYVKGDFVRRPNDDLCGESYKIVDVVTIFPHIYRLGGISGVWLHNDLILVKSNKEMSNDE